MRVVADDKIPFLKGILEPHVNIRYLPGNKITREVMMDADALLVRTRTRCTSENLEGTPVKFIATATIGYDHIDTRYCEQAGIKWVSSPGCNSGSVQQYLAAALLNLSAKKVMPLTGTTIGIVGAGNVGSKVEKIAGLMGMRVLVNDPPRERLEGSAGFVSLDVLSSEADIITFHVPLTMSGQDKTHHLVNELLIKRMKKGAWLINTSRGEVADTQSLCKAVKSGRLGGLILDVWENEPDIDLGLMKMASIATPHIAGYSTDGKANGTSMVVRALSEHFDLPARNWYPVNVPPPQTPVIEIDGRGKNCLEILGLAVAHTYDITEDDRNLRNNPSEFEKQRGEYRLRREFPAFTVNVKNPPAGIKEIMEKAGFKTIIS
ncbi:MAG: 4-phosphoerythronate dehydrogenase PdxB [Bacteroidales bacterium]